MKDNKWRSTWSATIEYVDIDTGEILTKKEYLQNYITVKTIKHGKRSKYGTGGIVQITKFGERNKQGQLF